MAESRALVPVGDDTRQVVASSPNDDAELSRLIQFYEEAEEAQCSAREKAERDRDYVDNKQLTDEEVRKLQKRGQPPIVLNVLRDRAAFLSGLEKKQRRDPKAYPRNNPNDVAAAEAFTDGMRYVVETADYPSQRSAAWKNLIIEGFGGVELAAVQKRGGWEFTIAPIPWDRAFYDPHSSKPDFSDARYFGQVLWMDQDEALERAESMGYVDPEQARQIIETTLASAPTASRTYDDKPKYKIWADGKRKRVRLVMMWHRQGGLWKYCEFTNAGKLAYAEAPYVDQDGESFCPWIFESANVDRDNNRYGEIRHLIDPQDEINKRRSKALHQSMSRGVIAEAGAVEDVNKTRRELTKPDFFIELAPGIERFEVVDGQQLAAGQLALLQGVMEYIAGTGPNQALLGQGVSDQSGRAIEAQQAGGLVMHSDLMDTLRRFDLRVFRAIASMMKQYWDAEKWVRVTDDDETPKWVGLNEPMLTDVSTGETLPVSRWRKLYEQGVQANVVPATDETGQPLRNNDVARLDMDILVGDAPDTITLAGEHYESLLNLIGTVIAQGLPPAVLKLAIELHPGLPGKRKKQLLDMIEQMVAQPPPPGAQDADRLQKEKLEADIADTRASAYDKLTKGEERMAKLALPAAQPPRPDMGAGLTDDAMAPMPGEPPMVDGPPGPPTMPPPDQMPPQGPEVGMMTGGGPLAA